MSGSLYKILGIGGDCRTWEIRISVFSILFGLNVLELLLYPVPDWYLSHVAEGTCLFSFISLLGCDII